MSDSKRGINAIVAGVLVLGIVIVGSCSKSPDSAPSAKPPIENLFAVQINNFEYTLSQVDQFLMGVSPIPMGLQMLVRMQLGGALGNPELTGLNMGGTFAAFGVLLGDESDQSDAASRMLIAGLIPVTDYEKLIGGNAKFGTPDANGISKLTVSLSLPGAPAGAGGPVILVAQLGDYALVTSNGQYDKLVEYRKLMGAAAEKSAGVTQLAGITDSIEKASKAPICIYGNIQAASEAFGPLLFEKIEEMKTSITNMDSNMQESIEKLEEMRNNLADTDSNKAKIPEINQKIQKLKEQHSDLQARIGKLEQETSRLANIDPNEKAEVEKLQKQVKILKERKELASNVQQAIEKLEQVKDELQTELPAATDQLDRQIQRLKDQQNRPSALQSPEIIAKVMDMYLGILETVMEEVQSFTVAVKPSADVLLITETVSAVPGTDMAAMLVADATASKENELLGYLEDGVAMNFAMKMNAPFWQKFNVKSMDLLGALVGQSVSADDMAKMKQLMTDSMDSMGGSLAGSFSVQTDGKSPFAFKYVVAVKDADKFDRMMDESVEMFNTTGIKDLYKGLGMEFDYTMKRNADSYKGVSIDSAKLVMKSTEPNSPPGQMIDAMYGEGFEYRWGVVEGLCAIVIGDDADSHVRELIDLVKAGGPKEICSEVKAGLAMLPDAGEADFFVTYNYVRLLKMVGGMMQGMGLLELGDTGMTMPEIDVPSNSNLNIAGKIGDGKIVVDIAVPKQHLAELMTAFMMLQQQMQAQQNVVKTKAQIASLEAAVEVFKIDTGRYPTEEEGLTALIKKPANAEKWNGPYFKASYMPKDAWNRDFTYDVDSAAGKFTITSYGADGKEGGEGLNTDLSSTDSN